MGVYVVSEMLNNWTAPDKSAADYQVSTPTDEVVGKKAVIFTQKSDDGHQNLSKKGRELYRIERYPNILIRSHSSLCPERIKEIFSFHLTPQKEPDLLARIDPYSSFL